MGLDGDKQEIDSPTALLADIAVSTLARNVVTAVAFAEPDAGAASTTGAFAEIDDADLAIIYKYNSPDTISIKMQIWMNIILDVAGSDKYS
jgi:hypothetical protein